MSAQNHISASCVISGGRVYKDQKLIFDASEANADTLLLNLYQHIGINYPKFYKMDKLSKLGWLASEILLEGSFEKERFSPGNVGLVLSNANSSIDADVKYWDSVTEMASPSLFVYTLPNIVIGEICIKNGFKGEHAFYITSHFDAAFVEQQVEYLLNHEILQACICGWVDIVGEEYKTALFLVEKGNGTTKFLAGEMDKIFNTVI